MIKYMERNVQEQEQSDDVVNFLHKLVKSMRFKMVKIILRIVECKSLMAGKKDYKISLLVMVITRKY